MGCCRVLCFGKVNKLLQFGVLVLVGCLCLSGCAGAASQQIQATRQTIPMDMGMEMDIPPATAKPQGSKPTGSENESDLQAPGETKLSCDQVGLHTGMYPEDGSDRLVENVAAVLVTNRTERFLELGTLNFEIDGNPATFVVTGLPPGESAWVMEAAAMVVGSDSKFTYQSCGTSFRDDVSAVRDEVSIRVDDGMLTAVNHTGQTLENVAVYYKQRHSDGNYFGGITYLVSFDTLEPGQSVERLGGHYSDENSEIVRISWQEK